MITKLKYGNTNTFFIRGTIGNLLIDTQRSYIHFSDEIFSRDKYLNYEPITTEKAIVISSEESRDFLKSIGINGEIVVTASHSSDSISLILDDGECFVGDLEPIEYLGGYEQNAALKSDWELIMRYTPKVINYAHANKKVL